MASLRDCELGQKKEDERPSTAPPRLSGNIAPPTTPPPREVAMRPSTGRSFVSTSDAATGIHAWLRVYARTVNFSNLPLTPQGAMMAQDLKPMPPKDMLGHVSPPAVLLPLQAFVAVVTQYVARQRRRSQAAPAKVVLPRPAATDDVPKRQGPALNDRRFFFRDGRPKLPVIALPTMANQLADQIPEWLEERWARGTLEEETYKYYDNKKDREYHPVYDNVSDTSVVSEVEVEPQDDKYEVEMLQALRVYARFLEDTKKALIMSDILYAATQFAQLRREKQRSEDFTQDMKVNLEEMAFCCPNRIRPEHLKPVYKQLGGDVEACEVACVDFRIFVLVLIGLAKFDKGPKIPKMFGEHDTQKQARKRLTVAIKVLCDDVAGAQDIHDDRMLTQDELFCLVLAMHLLFIENSHKLHELVRQKVKIMLDNAAADDEYANSLTKTTFPRLATHGVAHLVFPTVHEIAALNIEFFPDCFSTPEGQALLNRIPLKAQYVDCQPGSVEFVATEMPDIEREDVRGDGSPFLNGKEKKKYLGSDFFDPARLQERYEEEVRRAMKVRRLREAKRDAEEAAEAAEAAEAEEAEQVASSELAAAVEGEAKRDAEEAAEAAEAEEAEEAEQVASSELAAAVEGDQLALPPEPKLPAPATPREELVIEEGDQLALPPEPKLPAPAAPREELVIPAVANLALPKLPPEPKLPPPEWLLDGGAILNLSDDEMELPPPPQVRSPPARPKTGQDVPPLPLVMQHAHDSRPVFPQVPVSGIDDPRFWTYERYQRKKWELNCASACACENMKERQVKMMLFALVLAFLGIVAFGMRSSIADRMVSEAMLALGGVLVFLGCITCCKCLSETHDSEEVDKQLNHPDAAIGKPLMGIELDV